MRADTNKSAKGRPHGTTPFAQPDLTGDEPQGVDRRLHSPKLATELATPIQQTEARKAKALAQYRRFGSVSSACAAAGIARRTFYNWLEQDREFAGLLQDARDDVADELEEAAMRRAMGGSDRMIIFLLKANRPWKYRENATITMVSPIVKDHVRETIMIIRQMLTKEQSDAVLARLNVVWQQTHHQA